MREVTAGVNGFARGADSDFSARMRKKYIF